MGTLITRIPVISTYPLTEIFTAPDSCSDALYTHHSIHTTLSGASYFLRAQGTEGGFDAKYRDCYPPTFTTFQELFTATSKGRAIYSPGVCPAGYTSWEVAGSYSPNAATAYACCPLYVPSASQNCLPWTRLIVE